MKYLNGFLSPQGEFIPCDEFNHLDCATSICERKYPFVPLLNCLSGETYLLNKHYVELNKYSCQFNWYVDGEFYKLSSAQRDFLYDALADTTDYIIPKEQELTIKLVLLKSQKM